MSRVAVTLVLVLGACTPDIAPGSYLCGPEQACPEGQACNGPDNVCVLASAAQPFACGPVTEAEPNDGFATAEVIGGQSCVSVPTEFIGCLPAGDGSDWFQVTPPAACTAVAVVARVTFPTAFETIGLELRASDDSVAGVATECPGDIDDDGEDQLCLDVTVTPGDAYAVRVAHTGQADCGGACASNRYQLTVQLATP